MAHRDVITFERLQRANTGQTVADLSDIAQEANAVISGVSSMMRSRLSRVLIVESVTDRFSAYDWTEDQTSQKQEATAWASEQPVVQVETSAVSGRQQGRLVSTKVEVGAVDYFAGWRRPDQVLDNPQGAETKLPVDTGEVLEGLETLPPVIPEVIQEVAITITLHVLSMRDDNLGERTTRAIGGQETVVESADTALISREMGRLAKYDRSQVLH